MEVCRRRVIEAGLAMATLGPLAAAQASGIPLKSEKELKRLSKRGNALLDAYLGPRPSEPEEIALLVYPGMTVQDFVGPQLFFSMIPGANVRVVAKDRKLSPVMGDSGFAIVPNTAFEDCPEELDVLFVPGGSRGTIDVMTDRETIAFVQDRGSKAKWINAICTGALILGQAGLLKGKRAATHWAGMSLLPLFGATPVHQRVVVDGHLVTGGGISAGLDFGLFMISKLRNVNTAKYAQLVAEYQPQPFINAGRPELADDQLLAALEKTTQNYLNAARKAAREGLRAKP